MGFYICSEPVFWSQSVVHIEDKNSTVKCHVGKVVCILARCPTGTAATVGVDDAKSFTLTGKELRIKVSLFTVVPGRNTELAMIAGSMSLMIKYNLDKKLFSPQQLLDLSRMTMLPIPSINPLIPATYSLSDWSFKLSAHSTMSMLKSVFIFL